MSGFNLACPLCGSADVTPSGYGRPTPDLVRADETGEYHRVDREWHERAPTVHCTTCGFDWNDLIAEPGDLDENALECDWVL